MERLGWLREPLRDQILKQIVSLARVDVIIAGNLYVAFADSHEGGVGGV